MSNKSLMVYSVADLILRVQVVDRGRKKVFKDECSINNRKELKRIFGVLKYKYDIEIKNQIKKDVGWDLG